MKSAEIGFAAFLTLVAAVYGGMALRMPRGHLDYPGPGFFPLVVGAFFLLTTLACLVQTLRQPVAPPSPGEASPGRHYGKTVQLLACLVAYGFLLKPLGFPLALGAFLLAAMRIFNFRRWPLAVAVAAALTLISYVAFVEWLKVPLPMGVLDELLY